MESPTNFSSISHGLDWPPRMAEAWAVHCASQLSELQAHPDAVDGIVHAWDGARVLLYNPHPKATDVNLDSIHSSLRDL